MEDVLSLCDLFKEGYRPKDKGRTAVALQTEDCLYISTYSEIAELSNVVASALIDHKCTGKFIGVVASPSIHIPAIILGILKVPACFAPVDLRTNTALNEFIFSKLKIDHVICMASDCQTFIENLGEQFHMKCMDTPALVPYELVLISRASCDHQHQASDNSGIAYAMHTSGSTGTPKVIRVPHKCILPNITSLRTILKVTRDDVVFMASPLTFDPCIVEMFLALSVGATLFMVSLTTKLMPRRLAEALQDNNVTVLQATPSLLSRFGPNLLKGTILGRDSKLRALILGGEQCPVPAVMSSWRDEGNMTEFWNIYGITEVSTWATLYKIPEKDIESKVDKSVPLGEPLLGTVLEVRDDRGQAITSGKGQLYLGGNERVCLLDDETVVVPGTLRATGDIVQFSPQGLLYVGRMDHQIKRHGQRINLSQITEVISSIPIINSCCVLQEPTTNQLLLFTVIDSSLAERSVNAIYRQLKRALPKSYIPDHVYILEELPVTRHGKVDAKKLLARRTRIGCGTGCVSDEELRSLWTDILKAECEIKDESNFVLLGGDSFQAVRLLNQIELVIGRSIPDLLDSILHRKYYEILELLKKNSMKTTNSELGSTPYAEKSDTSIFHAIQNTDKSNDFGSNLDTNIERKRTIGVINDNLSKRSKIGKRITMNRDGESLESSDEKNAVFSDNQAILHHSISRGTQQALRTGQNILRPNDQKRNTHETVFIKEKWKWDTGKCIDASPLLVTVDGGNSVVYIGSHSHKFQAVSFKTGSLIWSVTLGDRVESSACISKCGNYIIVGCYDHNIYILSADNGDIIWLWETGGAVKSSPVIHPHTGVVFIGSHDHCLHAFDIQNKGSVFSTHCGGGSIFSSPCIDVATETVYVGTLNGVLTSIDCVSGNIKWMNNIGKPIFSSPAVTKEGVVVGCVDNHLYHISSSNEILWSFKTDAPIFSSPCLYRHHQSPNQLTVFGSHDSFIYCIDATGKQVWTFKAPSPVYSTPFIFHSDILHCEDSTRLFVVCCCTKGIIFILSLSTGELFLSWELNGEIFSSPIVHDNSIVVGCRDDNIYKLQLTAKD